MLSKDIVAFASNKDFYEAFAEYVESGNKTLAQKESLHNAFFAEVDGHTGDIFNGLPEAAKLSNPTYQWSFMSVVDATINAILPLVLMPQLGMFMDMRFVGVGDIVKFTVKPNEFFTVSKTGMGERVTHRQKQFATDVVLVPEAHIITVYTDMLRVMAGKENIVDFITRVVLSIEKSMYADALNALTTGLEGIPTEHRHEGAFNPTELVKLCQEIAIENGGVKPVVAGSLTALMNVLPDSTLGYRMDGTNEVNIMKKFYDFDIVPLDQAYAGDHKMILPDNKLYIVSPIEDKLLKGAVSDALQNSNEFYDNADLTSNFTMRKMWKIEFATAAACATYTING